MKPTLIILTSMFCSLALGGSVQADYMASVDSVIENAPETEVTSGRDVVLTSTNIAHSVSAGRDVLGTSCSIGLNLTAGRDTSLSACSVQGTLQTGRALKLSHSGVTGAVLAGQNAALVHSNLFGPVTVGGELVVDHSTLSGSLTVVDGHVMIFDSHLQDIRVKMANASVSTSSNGLSVQSLNGGRSLITVGSGSQSMVNGYTVRSTTTDTVVITPSLSIYENGQLKSGHGPKTYTDYLEQNPQAPSITGPGWPQKTSSNCTSDLNTPSVIEIMGETTVSGDIVFDNQKGQVRVHPPAKIVGRVIGGKVIDATH